MRTKTNSPRTLSAFSRTRLGQGRSPLITGSPRSGPHASQPQAPSPTPQAPRPKPHAPEVVVVDYEAGNLYSVGRALRHLGVDFVFSSEPEVLRQAERIILPGVGSAPTAMNSLRQRGLLEVIGGFQRPFLGICLGMQLLYETSQEENCTCLGVIEGSVRRFDSSQAKVPHIGWNQVRIVADASSNLFAGVDDATYFYFVHSYYAEVDEDTTRGITSYSVPFASAVGKDNFLGVQFHPELSATPGLRLLENFMAMGPPLPTEAARG